MVASAHPGVAGAATRLAYWPGSQNEIPLSSARAMSGHSARPAARVAAPSENERCLDAELLFFIRTSAGNLMPRHRDRDSAKKSSVISANAESHLVVYSRSHPVPEIRDLWVTCGKF